MTDDKIVQFPEPERLIWVCVCGCCTLFLHDDGTAECPSCGVMRAGEWKVPPDAKITPAESITTHKTGEPIDITNRRFSELMNDPDLMAACQIFRDGRVHSVIREREAETEERRAWWRKRVDDFLGQIFLGRGRR